MCRGAGGTEWLRKQARRVHGVRAGKAPEDLSWAEDWRGWGVEHRGVDRSAGL